MFLAEQDNLCSAEYVNRRHVAAVGGGGTAGQEAEHAFP